ncbi:STAS domain-containing protein [Bhargavaea cecembensis]|uniref:STAS domain-containing protein n=1 Tax=Bhargavaea cecembensis TaxID=394098 RepID=UPI0005907C99|nr:STAS domain-containing protein [Bhargavaea cecembensis]
MEQINQALFDFLKGHSDQITDDWLALREKKFGSIYSADAGIHAENTLREQNRMTNRTLATSLIGDKEAFESLKNEWAELVAGSRVRTGTPIHEVLEAVGSARLVFWTYVERFVREHDDEVKRSDLLRWSEDVNRSHDDIVYAFSKEYNELMQSRLLAQQSLIDELGSPVIKIDCERGILPLVGDIDTSRAQVIKQSVPQRCSEEGIVELFIDLSGVSIIDTMVAHQLYELTQILSLLGIKATVTGIRPEIAQTSIHLGLNFSGLDTYNSLQQALHSSPVPWA